VAISANAEAIKGLVILMADGKSYSRSLLRSILLQLGVKSIHDVGDGAAALAAVRTISPDIVIVDWELPILSGADVLRMIRASKAFSNPNLPVIVISSSGQIECVREANKLGVRHFLVRPISPKTLEQRLVGIVKESRKSALKRKYDIETLRQDAQPI